MKPFQLKPNRAAAVEAEWRQIDGETGSIHSHFHLFWRHLSHLPLPINGVEKQPRAFTFKLNCLTHNPHTPKNALRLLLHHLSPSLLLLDFIKRA